MSEKDLEEETSRVEILKVHNYLRNFFLYICLSPAVSFNTFVNLKDALLNFLQILIMDI